MFEGGGGKCFFFVRSHEIVINNVCDVGIARDRIYLLFGIISARTHNKFTQEKYLFIRPLGFFSILKSLISEFQRKSCSSKLIIWLISVLIDTQRGIPFQMP